MVGLQALGCYILSYSITLGSIPPFDLRIKCIESSWAKASKLCRILEPVVKLVPVFTMLE